MKFKISRTSYSRDIKPCYDAYKMELPYYHIRTCTEDEFNERFSNSEGLWRNNGTDHHITNEGHIIRQEQTETCWVIEFKSLKKLLEFSDQFGKIIIEPNVTNRDLPTIEIYDSYRE